MKKITRLILTLDVAHPPNDGLVTTLTELATKLNGRLTQQVYEDQGDSLRLASRRTLTK